MDIPEVHLYHHWSEGGFGNAHQHLQVGGKSALYYFNSNITSHNLNTTIVFSS
jgi:hypothetical protein